MSWGGHEVILPHPGWVSGFLYSVPMDTGNAKTLTSPRQRRLNVIAPTVLHCLWEIGGILLARDSIEY